MIYGKKNDSKKILLLFETKNFILYPILDTTLKSMIYDNILEYILEREKNELYKI